jgi:hypothetical protein
MAPTVDAIEITRETDRAAPWESTGAAWLIMILGLALRVYAAVRLPLEQDELYTLLESRDLFRTTLAPGIESRPLYYLIQHPLLGVSTSPLAIRMLPLVFGALGMWVTWLIGRKYFGRVGGMVALTLCALSPWHLYVSSMARYYALVYACAALAVLWLPDAYDSDSPRRYLAVLIVFVIGTLTHPSFVIPMIGMVGGLSLAAADSRLRFQWPSPKAWRFLWGPYLAIVTAEAVILKAVGRSNAVVNLGSRGIAATVRLLPAMIDWMTIPVFVSALVGSLILVRRRDTAHRLGVMAIAGGVVTGALLVLASTRTGVYADYGVGLLPMVILCAVAFAVRCDSSRIGGLGGAFATTAVIVGAGMPSIVSYVSDGLRFDYRPAYAEVARRDPDGIVLGWPEILRKQYGGALRGFELRPDSIYLNRILSREGALWAVVSTKRYGIVEDPEGVEALWLSRNCRIEKSYERPRFDYRVYRVDLYRCVAGENAAHSASVGEWSSAVAM